jgi:hypothetical protein
VGPAYDKAGPLEVDGRICSSGGHHHGKAFPGSGVTETTVQYETMRKMKSAFVNLYQASVENKSSVVIGGKDGKKQLIMGVPIYHGCYDRAQVGMHHRMGDKVLQDYGLSTQVAVALQVGLEREWEAAGNRLEIAQMACFALLG